MKLSRGIGAVLLTGALAFLGAPALVAQEEPEVDLAELIRQIRRNMVEVEKELDRVEANSAREAGREAEDNLQRLIESMQGRGRQITKDIDELIKNLPT